MLGILQVTEGEPSTAQCEHYFGSPRTSTFHLLCTVPLLLQSENCPLSPYLAAGDLTCMLAVNQTAVLSLDFQATAMAQQRGQG
jgi:hypothetical protein